MCVCAHRVLDDGMDEVLMHVCVCVPTLSLMTGWMRYSCMCVCVSTLSVMKGLDEVLMHVCVCAHLVLDDGMDEVLMHVCVCAHLVLDDGMDEVLLRNVVVNVLRSAGRVCPGR